MYCTVCATHLCAECSQLTHSTKTLAKHRRVPLADKPHEKTMCSQHQVHAIEFVCLEEGCQASPLMCCVCKEYGKHQGHKVCILHFPPSTSENIWLSEKGNVCVIFFLFASYFKIKVYSFFLLTTALIMKKPPGHYLSMSLRYMSLYCISWFRRKNGIYIFRRKRPVCLCPHL